MDMKGCVFWNGVRLRGEGLSDAGIGLWDAAGMDEMDVSGIRVLGYKKR